MNLIRFTLLIDDFISSNKFKQFDVLLTTNVFGDILSDVAAMITGGIGMLPSACIGGPVFYIYIHTYIIVKYSYYYKILIILCLTKNHALFDLKGPQLFEPVHGSAPDIDGEVTASCFLVTRMISVVQIHIINKLWIIGRSKSVGCGSHGRDASEVWFEGRSGRKTHRKRYFRNPKQRIQNAWYSHSGSSKFS